MTLVPGSRVFALAVLLVGAIAVLCDWGNLVPLTAARNNQLHTNAVYRALPSNVPSGTLGPLRVSQNQRFFIDQNGAPFIWLGDTCWRLLQNYDRTDTETYLSKRASQGFTVILAMAIGWDQNTDRNVFGDKPLIGDDPATPNEAFFQNVDHVIDLANQKGLTVALLPINGYYVNHGIVNTGNARAFGRWVGNRYANAPNVVWVLGGDVSPANHIPVYRELAAGLREGDGGRHLITYHPKEATSQLLQDETWLDLHMVQSWERYDSINSRLSFDYGLSSPRIRPVGLGEGAYEAGPEYSTGPITPLLIRKQAYWSYLSGGYHIYGHNDVWQKSPSWQLSLDAPGAQQLGVLRNVFGGLRWWDLAPDQSMFAGGIGSGATLNVAARSSAGDFAVVYISSQTTVTLDLSKLVAGSTAYATWIEPQTGSRAAGGTFATAGQASFSTPTGYEDAVLILSTNGPDPAPSPVSTATPTPGPTPTESCIPAPSDLISWWPGDGSVVDQAGNADGTLQNGAGYSNGQVGSAFDFSGNTSTVSLPVGGALHSSFSAFTLEAWIYPTIHGQDSLYNSYGHTIFSNTDDDGFALRVINGFLQTDVRLSSGDIRYTFNQVQVAAGTWSHVALTYDGVAVRAYLNSQLLGSVPASGAVRIAKNASTTPMIGNEPLGSAVQDSGFGWVGAIDELSIYRRALSGTEVQQLAAASGGKCKGTPTPTPIPAPTPTPTSTPTPPPSAGVIFNDDFNDNERDVTKWSFGAHSSPASYFDPQTPAVEQGQQFEITLPPNQPGVHYNGLVSVATWNLTDCKVSVEVVQPTDQAGFTETIFSIVTDSDNWYRFITQNGRLYFESKVAGVLSYPSVVYDPSQHRFWRVRHDAVADAIAFETSADGLTWVTWQTTRRQLSLTEMRIELNAGASNSHSYSTTAIFDNVTLENNP